MTCGVLIAVKDTDVLLAEFQQYPWLQIFDDVLLQYQYRVIGCLHGISVELVMESAAALDACLSIVDS